VYSVAWSPDGKRILTGGLRDTAYLSEDSTAKVWDAGKGQELLTLKGHTGDVLSVAWSPDGKRVVTGSADQTAKVWEE
jgi:WD40 repeat protein